MWCRYQQQAAALQGASGNSLPSLRWLRRRFRPSLSHLGSKRDTDWKMTVDGRLPPSAAEQFDVFVTIDRTLRLQPYFVTIPMDGPAPGEARTGC
jgi:hypothetical protein